MKPEEDWRRCIYEDRPYFGKLNILFEATCHFLVSNLQEKKHKHKIFLILLHFQDPYR